MPFAAATAARGTAPAMAALECMLLRAHTALCKFPCAKCMYLCGMALRYVAVQAQAAPRCAAAGEPGGRACWAV